MADSKPAPEPTMEEILSSIRRIIAEDEEKDDGAPRAQGPAAPGGGDEVLDLTEVVPEPEPARPRAIDPGPSAAEPPVASAPTPGHSPPPFAPGHAQPPFSPATPAPEAAMPPSATQPPDAAESLISADAAKASAQALARLTRVSATEERRPAASGGVPVEQFLSDLLTPLLRDWLEKNLPGIVERVVEQEVKKLARRAELL